MKHVSIKWFAENIIKLPLYDYQVEIADNILDSVFNNKGLCFSVMLSRQMGKNQLSAALEAYLLYCMPDGSIVKAAPAFVPQILNSKMRLLKMLESPHTRDRIWKSWGYIIGLSQTPDQREAQTGPKILFFSAAEDANIVGATASLLLEVDEAQDVSISKFDRDLRPMASTTNATTVCYGTAWSDDTLLAMIRANNLELEQQDGIKRHFEYDWRTLAAINSNYDKFVRSEIQRLGEDHITIRTQYRLLTISGAGFLLNEMQRHLIRGSHGWLDEPDPDADDCFYIAGLDIGGEHRPTPGEESKHREHDSSIMSIAQVDMNELGLPVIKVVHQHVWNNVHYLALYEQIKALCELWNIRTLVVDKTGLGEVMAALLEAKLGEDRVMPFHFTRPSKSKLTYQFLGLINSGRMKLYSQEKAPTEVFDECWKQMRLARYSVPGQGLLNMMVNPEDGHDDMLISVALLGEAIREWSAPAQEAAVIRPRRLYGEEGRY